LSKETIPSVQFLMQFPANGYIFISTDEMEAQGISTRLMEVLQIPKERVQLIRIDPFNFEDNVEVLQKAITADLHYSVNITGGTKLMTLSVNRFFESKNASIYYLIGSNQRYLQLSPMVIENLVLDNEIDLSKFLLTLGFECFGSSLPSYPVEQGKLIFDYYNHGYSQESGWSVLERLKPFREEGKGVGMDEVQGLSEYLWNIGFVPVDKTKLNKRELKYLTGEWFEEWLFYQVKAKYDLDEDFLGLGLKLRKSDKVENEFDVLWVEKDVLHVVECKSFIWKDLQNQKEPILDEALNKLSSLSKNFGLTVKSIIATATDLSEPRHTLKWGKAASKRIELWDLRILNEKFNLRSSDAH
jgi:hypothetical protein